MKWKSFARTGLAGTYGVVRKVLHGQVMVVLTSHMGKTKSVKKSVASDLGSPAWLRKSEVKSTPINFRARSNLTRTQKMNFRRTFARCLLAAILVTISLSSARGQRKAVTVKGSVLDSACAFIKNLKKPVSAECALKCAKAGSPLVILADDGTIYWPIFGFNACHWSERVVDEVCWAKGDSQRKGI